MSSAGVINFCILALHGRLCNQENRVVRIVSRLRHKNTTRLTLDLPRSPLNKVEERGDGSDSRKV